MTEGWTQRRAPVGIEKSQTLREVSAGQAEEEETELKTVSASYSLSGAPPTLVSLSNGNPVAVRHRPSVGRDAARAGPAVRLRYGAQL